MLGKPHRGLEPVPVRYVPQPCVDGGGALRGLVQLRSCARGRGARIHAELPLRLRGGDGDEDGGKDAQYDSLPRESKVYIAKMAEQAERFEEMVSATKSIAKMGVDLTVEERSLLSVAYKNVVGARRASWKIISSIQHKETDEHNLNLIREYLVKVEKELSDVCREIISLLGKSSAHRGVGKHAFQPRAHERAHERARVRAHVAQGSAGGQCCLV